MLDTHARKYVQPLIERVAKGFIRMNLSANQTTIIAMLLGLTVSLLFYLNLPAIFCIMLLWISGLIDAVDGSIARLTKTSSPLGTLMDITFDRLVEIMLIIVLALKFPAAQFSLLLLALSIILSMTIFLTVGILSTLDSNKTFYYQAGLAERTEGFFMFSLMLFFSNYLIEITLVFAVIVTITAVQRFIEACRIIK